MRYKFNYTIIDFYRPVTYFLIRACDGLATLSSLKYFSHPHRIFSLQKKCNYFNGKSVARPSHALIRKYSITMTNAIQIQLNGN